MNNRLYCTFTTPDNIEEITSTIQTSYVILFNKIFVLESLDGEKIMLTYNVDLGNSSSESMVNNTILVHRKKQTNTLYTINALNEVVANLNNGIIDSKFMVPWENFKNTLLITNSDGLNKISTRIYKIINVEKK